MNNQIKTFVIVIVLLVVGIFASVFLNNASTPTVADGKYDTLAQCIKDSGATFYGAFWCPHCTAQKKLFGSAVKFLPYVECSTPDGNAQTQICIDKKITGYPTWVFADGSVLNGEVALDKLAEKTNCPLPVEPVAEAK